MLQLLCDLTPELDVKTWLGLGIFFLFTCVPAAAYFIKHTWFEPKPADVSQFISRAEFDRDMQELKTLISRDQQHKHQDDQLLQQTLRTISERLARIEGSLPAKRQS
jgi:hypothetical protein